MKCSVSITVNGVRRSHDVEPRLLLVHYLRETLGLTGTNVGCDTSQCGSCTVLLDGKAVKSCTMLAVQADGAKVTTIEGLATNGKLHPLQDAFWEKHGLQCGFCTPGMILTACNLLEQNPKPSRRRDPPRARRQPLPLHRLPEHRGGGPGSRRADAGVGGGGHGIAHLRLRHQAARRPAAPHRPGEATPTTSSCPAWRTWRSCARPTRTRASRRSGRRRPPRWRACSASSPART